MKKYLFILSALLFNTDSFSQTKSELATLEMKYWKLRGRLIGDENNRDVYNGFMQVGALSGMSIPAASRHPLYGRNYYDFNPFATGSGCSNQYINGVQTYAEYDNFGMLIAPYLPLIDPRDGKELMGELKFSDNSIINIGNYIGVLATEWALLHRENKSTLQTEKELYFALNALNRLDLAGESLYSGTSTTPLKNGFLMRNDADEKFQLNSTGISIDLVKSSIACMEEGNASCTESNATKHISNAMSQDEVVGLLLGFALMKKMVPDYVSYNGNGLRQWSKEITERIVKYVRKGGNIGFWTILDPDEGKRVCRGSMAIWNSYAMAATAEYICDYSVPFQNGWSLSLGKIVWQTKKNGYALNNNNVIFSYLMPSVVQTTLGLNNYEAFVVPGVGNGNTTHDGAYNVSMFLKLLACSRTAPRPFPPFMDFTGKYLTNNVSQTYLKNLYELVGSVINGYAPIQSESYWRGEFNKLNCGCNCAQGGDPISYHGCQNYFVTSPSNIMATPPNPWAVEDRWAFTMAIGSYDVSLDEYNGLDYMLAYNLYKWKYFSNGYNTRVRTEISNQSFPFLSPPNPYDSYNQYSIGSQTYPLERKAVFSINSENVQINASSKVTFLAGSEIKLLPGFYAKPNSVFKAEIMEYDCQPNINQVPGGSEYVSYKNGSSDSSYSDDFNFLDTTISIQLDQDSNFFYDLGPDIDSSMWVFTTTDSNGSLKIELNPNYSFTKDGEIIYTPLNGERKSSLQYTTLKNASLYPNPTSSNIYLEYQLYLESDVSISVINQLGQSLPKVADYYEIQQEIGTYKLELNTINLSSGVYYCIIEIDGQRVTKKFTVNK